AIRYLAADHPLRKDQTAMEAAGLGVATVEVVLAEPGITGTEHVAPLRALARSAADLPGVAASVGWPHLVDQTRVATGRAAVDDWVIAQLEAQTTAATFGSKDRARIALIVQTIDADDLDALKAALRRLAKTHVPTAKLTITGNYDLLLHAQDALLETIQVSLLWTTILMQLALMIVLRSLRIGLLALIPNLFPVALNLVAMKLLGIPLDIGTSMTAAIALGIAVDDTLHFTLAAKANGLMASNNLRASARAAAVAIVISSLVIGLGFAALLSSDFIPTRRFGGLCGLAMLSALAADLLVLPPLLRWATRAVEPK
ncbi:MAG: MMPL family transporter, partial [Myxococcota bacterium]